MDKSVTVLISSTQLLEMNADAMFKPRLVSVRVDCRPRQETVEWQPATRTVFSFISTLTVAQGSRMPRLSSL